MNPRSINRRTSRTLTLSETIASRKVAAINAAQVQSDRALKFGSVGSRNFASCKEAFLRLRKGDTCDALSVYTNEHPALNRMTIVHKDIENPLCIYDFEATLLAFSPKSNKTFETRFPVKGVLFHDFESKPCN